MNVQPIPQLVLHEIDNFENMFFNITHNLDNINLNKFHIFKEHMVKDGGCNFFWLKLNDWVQFITFMQEWSNIMNHGQLEKKIDNQYFELTTKQTNFCHNHPPHETHRKFLQHTQVSVKAFFYICWILGPKFKINNTQGSHNFMCKEATFKL